jgi:5,10-methylenetetrahydromethanopterin reductase
MLELGCAFATSYDTPKHVAFAEQLGYKRAWLYDSPALYPDVWITLADCARRTSRIELGPGVLVPSLRHPMVNAAAIAHLVHLAPGRVNVSIGSGYTGRVTFGQRPLKWSYVREYVLAVRALLRGETVEWEGGVLGMMHPDAAYAPPRPIDVPILIGTGGPKGNAVAQEVGDGVLVSNVVAGFDRCVVLTFGTVLADGEDPMSERAVATAGHSVSKTLHAMYDRGIDMTALPGGAEWVAATDALPAASRHLAVHDRHLVSLAERDRPMVTPELMRRNGARTEAQWCDHLDRLEANGATEIAYQPAGPDIADELRRFADVAQNR